MSSDTFITLGTYLERGQNNQDPGEKRNVRWGALSAMIILLGGTFGLGFTASSTVSQSEAAQLKLRILQLEQQQEQLRKEFKTTEKKEEFRKLSYRIKKGKEALAKSPASKDLREQVKVDQQALATFIVENADQEKDQDDVPVMRIVKRDTQAESVVKFRGDDAAYIVPIEVKKLTPPGTFYRTEAGSLEKLKIYTPGCPKWEPILTDSRRRQTRHISVDIATIR